MAELQDAGENFESLSPFRSGPNIKVPIIRRAVRNHTLESRLSGSTVFESTVALSSSEDTNEAGKCSGHEQLACSKCHKMQKPGEMALFSKLGITDHSTQEERGRDKVWNKACQKLALCFKDLVSSARRPGHLDFSELKCALKAFQDPEFRPDWSDKCESSNTSIIPNFSDFSDKAELNAYLNPDQAAPTTHDPPAYPSHSDLSTVPIAVGPPATENDSSADAGVRNEDSIIPKVVRLFDISDCQSSHQTKTRRQNPAFHHLPKSPSPTVESQMRLPDKEGSHTKLLETTLQVLQQEIQVLQQEKACMLEEMHGLRNHRTSNPDQNGKILPFDNATRSQEVEIAPAFRQQPLVKNDFERQMAAAEAQPERDNILIHKEVSRHTAGLDAGEEALLKREQEVGFRERSVLGHDQISPMEEEAIYPQTLDAAGQEHRLISRDLTAYLQEKPASLPQLEVLARGEHQQEPVSHTNAMPENRMLSLRELNGMPLRPETATRSNIVAPPCSKAGVGERVRTDPDDHGELLGACTSRSKYEMTSNEEERLATTFSFPALLQLKRRTKDRARISSGSNDKARLSKSSEQPMGKLTDSACALQSAVFTDHAGTKRKTESKAASKEASAPAKPGLASSAQPNSDNAQGDVYDDSDEECDNSDDGNPKRRKKIPHKSTSRQRDLACPYSKYDIVRYSQRNLTEKQYRGCSKCLFPNISCLKQHLYRNHQRPVNHCLRCFEVFKSDQLLDQHSQQKVSCSRRKCPFPERFTPDQMRLLKRKWRGKSAEECWFMIFGILFPNAQVPASPYADDLTLPSADAPQMLRQIVLERLRQHQHSPTTVQLLSDEVQILLGQTIEDSFTELFRQLSPATISNRQSSSPVSGGYASDDYVSNDHDSEDLESNLQGPDSDQVVEDQCHLEEYDTEDDIALPTTSLESFPNLLASKSTSAYYEHSGFDNAVGFDEGACGLSASSFIQHEKCGNEQSNRESGNPSLSAYQALSQYETSSDYNSSSLQSLDSAPAPQTGYCSFDLSNKPQNWSGTPSANSIPMGLFAHRRMRSTGSNSVGTCLSAHTGFDGQQLPQKTFEPSIRSFDSGYASTRSQSDSRPSPDLSAENSATAESWQHHTAAPLWSPYNAYGVGFG